MLIYAIMQSVKEAFDDLSQVTSQHAPIGQGFTVSDLDLVLREESTFSPYGPFVKMGHPSAAMKDPQEHNDVSIKLAPQ